MPIPVAARSKAYICGRLVAGVADSNPAWGMDVCLLCLYVVLSCVGRGLCDGLITRPGESYRVSKYMCDHKNPERGPMFQLGTTGKLMYKQFSKIQEHSSDHETPTYHCGVWVNFQGSHCSGQSVTCVGFPQNTLVFL
jgi:hypothetical protein